MTYFETRKKKKKALSVKVLLQLPARRCITRWELLPVPSEAVSPPGAVRGRPAPAAAGTAGTGRARDHPGAGRGRAERASPAHRAERSGAGTGHRAPGAVPPAGAAGSGHTALGTPPQTRANVGTPGSLAAARNHPWCGAGSLVEGFFFFLPCFPFRSLFSFSFSWILACLLPQNEREREKKKRSRMFGKICRSVEHSLHLCTGAGAAELLRSAPAAPRPARPSRRPPRAGAARPGSSPPP